MFSLCFWNFFLEWIKFVTKFLRQFIFQKQMWKTSSNLSENVGRKTSIKEPNGKYLCQRCISCSSAILFLISENCSFVIETNSLPSFAITPGRKVHFAAVEESPIEFKSSIIRFCIYESKAFKKRLVVVEAFVSSSRLKYNGKV